MEFTNGWGDACLHWRRRRDLDLPMRFVSLFNIFPHQCANKAASLVLGALSKVLATITTHPLIVAKTMLQSKPPDCRNGKPFSGFTEVLLYIMKNEGLLRLYKGLAPQIIKGFLVQGLMMMLKERYVSAALPNVDTTMLISHFRTEILIKRAILLNGKKRLRSLK